MRELERRAAASDAAPERDPQRAKFHDFTDAELQAMAGTIAERYLRYLTTVGDSLQGALEPALGAQQASAVRDALAGSRSSMSGCAH